MKAQLSDQEGAINRIRELQSSAEFAQMLEDSKFAEEMMTASEAGDSVESKYREILLAVYNKHNPAKLQDVEVILKEWRGREAELIANLEARYPGAAATGESVRARTTGVCPSITLRAHSTHSSLPRLLRYQLSRLSFRRRNGSLGS